MLIKDRQVIVTRRTTEAVLAPDAAQHFQTLFRRAAKERKR